MSGYKEKDKKGQLMQNPWTTVRTDFTRGLADLRLKTSFKHEKLSAETPGIVEENKRYDD